MAAAVVYGASEPADETGAESDAVLVPEERSGRRSPSPSPKGHRKRDYSLDFDDPEDAGIACIPAPRALVFLLLLGCLVAGLDLSEGLFHPVSRWLSAYEANLLAPDEETSTTTFTTTDCGDCEQLPPTTTSPPDLTPRMPAWLLEKLRDRLLPLAVGPLGNSSCPLAASILNASECSAAALQLNVSWSRAPLAPGAPPGCHLRLPGPVLAHNDANRSLGAPCALCQPLCRAPAPFALANLSGACPEGLEYLLTPDDEDEKPCRQSAHFLARGRFIGHMASAIDPPGCIFRIGDNDIFFNDAEGRPRSGKRKRVCARPVPPLHVRTRPTSRPGSGPPDVLLFCFAFTALQRPWDGALLREKRWQFRKCNSHLFFTDDANPSEVNASDLVRVHVPQQWVGRQHARWLQNRSFVALLPCWAYVVNVSKKWDFDWYVQADMDAFLSPRRLRSAIHDYQQALKKEKASQAEMLMMGDTYLLSSRLLKSLRTGFRNVGAASDDVPGLGCPRVVGAMKNGVNGIGGAYWIMPTSCTLEKAYSAWSRELRAGSRGLAGCRQGPNVTRDALPPTMASSVASAGSRPANVTTSPRPTGPPPPPPVAGCWDLRRSPYGRDLKGKLRALRELARLQGLWPDEARNGSEPGEEWELLYSSRGAPILEHANHPLVHKMARMLLRPL